MLQLDKDKSLEDKQMGINTSLHHILIHLYQQREMDMTAVDISKRHLKSTTEYGTNSIQSPDGDIIDLKTRAVLSTSIITNLHGKN